MRSLLIDVEKAEVKEIEINDFDDFFKYIDCSAIDVAGRYIGDENRFYDIFIDDCGMLKENPIVSALYFDDTSLQLEVMLVGNLIITKTGKIGEQIPLTDEDIDYLYRYIKTGYKVTENGIQNYPILVDVKYHKD